MASASCLVAKTATKLLADAIPYYQTIIDAQMKILKVIRV